MNVILGNIYNAQSDLTTVASIINNITEDTVFCLGGIGKEQLKSNVLGLLYSDGVRVGLEDNLYDDNKMKTTNIYLLKRIHSVIKDLGFSVMKPKEFQNLGYVNRKNNNFRG